MRTEDLAKFINERHAIYMRKEIIEDYQENCSTRPYMNLSEAGAAVWGGRITDYDIAERWDPHHLTDDPILGKFRFCNVYRELDRVTVWIREHIREPYADHEDLWFMLAVARMINWPPTLQHLMDSEGAWPGQIDFDPERMTTALEGRRATGAKMETGAYMIRAESNFNAPWYSWSKQRYVSEVVLGRLWDDRELWNYGLALPSKIQKVWEWFQYPRYIGWGPFMAYQVVVDLRWTCYLRDAPDIQTWAAVGPGSTRGLNRFLGYPVHGSMTQFKALEGMLAVREALAQPGILAPWVTLPDLSDVQNCLCEFDKYERVRLGEGRPRSMYVPGRGS